MMGDHIDIRITPTSVSNWADTYRCKPTLFLEPTSISEIQAALADAASANTTVRVVGSAHSPNACAMSEDVCISLRNFNAVLSVEADTRIVTAQAGARVEDLHPYLDERGLAMPNLGSISEQTLAGMISTGTHGTGRGTGCMATFVTSLQLVLASGELVTCSRTQHPALFQAALCSLGVLGVLVTVSFRAVPAFDLHSVESPSTLPAVLSSLQARVESAPFYRFWWFPHTDKVMEWRARPVQPLVHRAPPPSAWGRLTSWLLYDVFGFHGLQTALVLSQTLFPHGSRGLVPLINSVWYDALFGSVKERVDRSDRVFNINCLFKQHVDEWSIPVDALPAALASLGSIINSGSHGCHFPIEVRFTAGDDIWLSPSYGRATAWIGIIQYKPYGLEQLGYRAYFRAFEEAMGAHGGRPHWAKDFHWTGSDGKNSFARAYPKWGEFQLLRAALDKQGLFLNPWARRVLGLPGKEEQGAGETCSASMSEEKQQREVAIRRIRNGLELEETAAPAEEAGEADDRRASFSSTLPASKACPASELASVVGTVPCGLGYDLLRNMEGEAERLAVWPHTAA